MFFLKTDELPKYLHSDNDLAKDSDSELETENNDYDDDDSYSFVRGVRIKRTVHNN